MERLGVLDHTYFTYDGASDPSRIRILARFKPRSYVKYVWLSRSAVNINVSRHSSKIVVNHRFNTIFTSNQAPKDIFSSFFVHFEVKTDQKSSPKGTKNRSHRFHAIISSYVRTFILSYSHTSILLYSHTIIPSFSATLIHSYSHTFISSYSRTLLPSYSLILTR